MALEDYDHCPLLLGLNDSKHGRPQFHFESFWTKLDGFQEAVSSAWTSIPPTPCPFLTLNRKFRAVSKGLKSWSAKAVGQINFQLALAREILHQFEIAQNNRQLSPGELWFKKILKKRSLALASLKRTMARLHSRISWLKDGDANTRLFHLHARHRKRKNFIGKLITGERICSSHVVGVSKGYPNQRS